MKYEITIIMDGAAFYAEDDERAEKVTGTELARILRKIADRCEDHDAPADIRLQDINGNYCGEARLDDE